MSNKMIAATVAAIALAVAAVPVASFAHGTKVPCYGTKGAKHAKKGYVMKTEKQCKKLGGTTTAPSDMSTSTDKTTNGTTSTGTSSY